MSRAPSGTTRPGESWKGTNGVVPFVVEVRELIEDWFSGLCANAMADLRSR